MKQIDIIIPYIKGPDNGLELRYTLRSIEKNFQHDNYRIFVVGEIPDWLTNVEAIPFKRVAEQKGRNFIDQILKLYMLLTDRDISPQFIWTYDDVYFTKPLKLADIKKLKAVASMTKYPNHLENSGAGPNWRIAYNRSLKAAAENKGTDYNYETHLPRYFTKFRMLKLINRFNILAKPYLISTLYYNFYHRNEEPLCLFDQNPGIRFLLRSMFDVKTLQKHMQRHQFTNNDPASWNVVLKKVLETMFRHPSKYEKV
nr:hypothetical protein [Bacteroidota bacterium]